jgi:hypothetical protein
MGLIVTTAIQQCNVNQNNIVIGQKTKQSLRKWEKQLKTSYCFSFQFSLVLKREAELKPKKGVCD